MKLCDLLTAKILNSYKNIIVLQKDKNSAAGGIILEVEKDKQKDNKFEIDKFKSFENKKENKLKYISTS